MWQQTVLALTLSVGTAVIVPVIVKLVVQKIAESKSVHIHAMAALGGVFAREVVQFVEATGATKGIKGMDKLEKAIELYIEKMADAGFAVSYSEAGQKIEAVHKELTDDKSTKFNESFIGASR